jgi:hypothetical protein
VAYYLRVFCRSLEPVLLRDVVEQAASEGVALTVSNDVAPDDPDWRRAEIGFSDERPPLIAEIDRDSEVVTEEVEDFTELIGPPGLSRSKRGVLDHLRETKAILALQIVTASADDATYDAAGAVVRYFAQERDGVIQADGEGSYDGTRLIVPVA